MGTARNVQRKERVKGISMYFIKLAYPNISVSAHNNRIVVLWMLVVFLIFIVFFASFTIRDFVNR